MTILSFLATMVALANLPTQPKRVISQLQKHGSLKGISSGAILLAIVADFALFNYAQHYNMLWVSVISLVGFFFRSFTLVMNAFFEHDSGNTRRGILHIILVLLLLVGFAIHTVWFHLVVFSILNITCSSLALAPQANILFKTKTFEGIRSISVAQYVLWIISNSLWILYALSVFSFVILIPAIIKLSISIFVVVKYYQLKSKIEEGKK